MFSVQFGWRPINTAPMDKDVMLFVTDGQGEPYAVYFKLTSAGWVSSGKGTPLAVKPLQWKPYAPRQSTKSRKDSTPGEKCSSGLD
jgi:hypothetical protein